MNQLLAYQLGGVFLLAALMIYGTMIGKRLPIGTIAGVGAVMALIFVIYSYGPDLRSWIQPATQESQSPSPRIEPAPAPRPAVARRRTQTARVESSEPPAPQPEPKIITVPDDAPAAITQPIALAPAPSALPKANPVSLDQHIDDSRSGNPYDSGIKRGAKAVGRFFHVIHRDKP